MSKSAKLKLGIIGSGNLAIQLAPALENAGHRVMACHSLHLNKAKQLADRMYQCEVLHEPDFAAYPLDLVLMAVSDEAIETLAAEMTVPENCSVAHTAGGVSIEALAVFGEHAGVFYPVQSFSKGRKVDFEMIPICIEAIGKTTEQRLYQLGSSLSKELYYLNSVQRKDLHIAAVFASNFTNFMLSIAWEYLHEQDLTPDLLVPLVRETIAKAIQSGPESMQTGPARRGDLEVVEAHLSRLKAHPAWQRLYQEVSAAIQDHYRLGHKGDSL